MDDRLVLSAGTSAFEQGLEVGLLVLVWLKWSVAIQQPWHGSKAVLVVLMSSAVEPSF